MNLHKVMIVHDDAKDFQIELEQRFPAVSFAYVSNPENLLEALQVFQPEIVFSIKSPGFPASEHIPLKTFASIRWIHVGGSGYDHLLPWDRERLTVTNCAGVLSRHLAETVIGALISLNGNLLCYARQQREACWETHTFRPLSQQVILIVGMGQIGAWVAQYAKTLGMYVIGVRRQVAAQPWVDEMVTPDRLGEVLERADVVSLHVRLNPETYRLFDRSMFARFKPGALFINTSRGAVVDENALIESLSSGRLRGAYLDVFETEPLPAESSLWTMPNVLMTPHVADNIVGWPQEFASFFSENLNRWLEKEPLLNVVD